MKLLQKTWLVAALGLCGVLSASADTVELLPGKITGTIHLSSETLQSGSVYANAVDGSGSASSSFNGETYSIVVPAGKTWRLQFYVTPQTSGNGSYLSFNLSTQDQIAVGASETVTKNYSVTTARIAASVQVSNGTLTNIGQLSASGYLPDNTNFSSSGGSINYLPSLIADNVNVSGTATVTSTTNQVSTQTLPNKTINVSASGGSVSWSLDAAFAAGAISGAFDLRGAVTPNSTGTNLYSPTYAYVGGFSGNGNISYQFDNLMAGTHYLYGYAYYNDASLNLYRTVDVTAGNVSTANFSGTVALANVNLSLSGFLTSSQLSGASIYGSGPDNTSASANLKTTGVFTAVVLPGNWSFPQTSFYGYDTSTPGDYFYYSISRYDYSAGNNPVTFAAGDNKTLPGISLNTTQTDLTFDVIEPAGTATETVISYPSINGSFYDGQQSTSFYAANYGTPTAKPRVRIVGVPGTYTVDAYGTVDGSQVSFGHFTLELKVPIITSAGTGVSVQPTTNSSVTFANVTSPGVTTGAELPVGPGVPAGYTILTNSGQKTYYSLSTTATFSGNVDVTVNYDPSSISAADAPNLKLLAYNNSTQTWTDITTSVDTTAHKVTGSASALTTFVLVSTHTPVLSAVNVPAETFKDAALTFTASVSDADAGDHLTASWSWGDGTNSSVTPSANGSIAATHTYTANGVYHGTLTVTDATGNTASQAFTVTVGSADSTPPVISVAASVSAEATSAAGAVVTFFASATDDTDGTVSTSASPASGSTFALGTTPVTITATDAAGNTAHATLNVTVVDTTAPVITAPATLSAEATSAAGAAITYSATASDLVSGNVVVGASSASGSTFPLGTSSIMLVATDGAGNTSTATIAVTVKDTTAPVISSVPSNLTLEATSAAGAVATFSATATDAVGATVSYSKNSGTVFPLGTTTVTVNAIDAAGNTATPASFTVTVKDTTAPVISSTPASFTLEATSAAGAVATFSASATDATGATVSYSQNPGTVFPIGTTTVTVSAVDASGNAATPTTFTVTVKDTTAPVITSTPANITLEAANAAGTVANFSATASDSVGATVTYSKAPGSVFPIGTTTVKVCATDASGNAATPTTFTVTVSDTTAPVFTSVPGNLVLEATSAAGASASFAATASDAVGATVSYSQNPGTTFPIGSTTVTVTARDSANNTISSSFTVLVKDTTAPVITAPANVVVEATSASGATATFAASVSDAVGASVSYSKNSGTVFPLGATTVTVNAVDASGNAAAPKTFTITVKDSTAPVITSLPGNQTLEATSAAGAVANFNATATDTTGATVTYSVAAGSVFPVGATTVVVTATDAAGNKTTGSFTVTVKDTTKPVITAPANLVIEATSTAGATVNYSASVSDNVGATLTASKASGTVFPIGTTTVTLNATDAAGNAAVAKTFTVTVRDTSGPVLTLPGNIVAEASCNDGAKVTFAASAVDAVSGARSVSYSRTSGSWFPMGVTTVTVTSTDALGNKSTGTFTVTVKDTTAPTLYLSRNIVAKATSAAGARVDYQVSASDTVDSRVTIATSKASGSTFPLGVTNVLVTATDDSGNVSTGIFTVTVADQTKPEITSLSVNPTQLLKGDHKMVNVTVYATATDKVDSSLNLRIISVTSDEAVTGTSSADVGPDWVITGPLTLQLRDEYDPRGDGRIYTILVAATDDAGNTRTRTIHVLVPKKSSTRFEDCDRSHRSEKQRCDDEARDCDSRDQGDDHDD